VASSLYPFLGFLVPLVVPDEFKNIDIVKNISEPVLFVYGFFILLLLLFLGTNDEMVPSSHSPELYSSSSLILLFM
jgi:hypothetical protein